MLFLSSVYFYGPVYFAGEVAQAPEVQRECESRSTVFVVGAKPGSSYTYANGGEPCASDSAVISIRRSHSGSEAR